MLGLAEYITLKRELQRLGREYDDKIADAIRGEPKQSAIGITQGLAQQYRRRFRLLLDQGLREVGDTAVRHYAKELGSTYTDNEIKALVDVIVKQQYMRKYYGATLNARLAVGDKRLQRVVVQTGQIVDKDGFPHKLPGLFTESVPFGAQINVDARLLLGTAVKIEQDVAKEMASKAQMPFIRWVLSGRHSTPDACDWYANNTDDHVVAYLQQHNIDQDTRGLFFAEELPSPPHPNCRCEYELVSSTSVAKTGPVKRAINKLRNLVRRLRAR